MIGSILEVLVQGFTLWNTKEGRKYADDSRKLLQKWNEEFDRPDRSQLALDRIEDEMIILKKIFLQIPTEAKS